MAAAFYFFNIVISAFQSLHINLFKDWKYNIILFRVYYNYVYYGYVFSENLVY